MNREEWLKDRREKVEARRARIIQYMKERGPVTPEQIVEGIGIHRPTLSVDMAALRAAGRLQFHLGIPGILEVAPEKEK